jgi:hypothetical protein
MPGLQVTQIVTGNRSMIMSASESTSSGLFEVSLSGVDYVEGLSLRDVAVLMASSYPDDPSCGPHGSVWLISGQ